MTAIPPEQKDHYPPIGYIKTCFYEKFGVPRQSMMIAEARGVLKLTANPSFRVALNHLEEFTHIWVVFVFHTHTEKGWRPTIRPPRLDAPRRVGVFASRSPHRPNPIGMSVVKLEKIDLDAPGGIELHLSGVDFLDGTPVLDIKPYLPYSDSFPEASSGWAKTEIPKYAVDFSAESLNVIAEYSRRSPGFKNLVQGILEWDPRPTSQRRAMPIENEETQGMVFGVRIVDFDVHWEIRNKSIFVLTLTELN